MKYFLWLLKAAIFFTLFAFALNNQQDATVHFFFGTSWTAPLVLVVLAAFALGLIVGVLGMVPRWLKHRNAARSTQAPAPAAEGAAPATAPKAPPSPILPGDVQRMSAGKGILHSEFNHEAAQPTHLLQIWIQPTERGIRPGYEQKHFDAADKRGRLRLVASPDGREGSVSMTADALLYAGLFDGDESASLTLDPLRKAYVHVARGEVSVNGQPLKAGDAAMLEGEAAVTLDGGHEAEVLVFDLAA